jgi:hypothetical protein
MVGKDGQEIWSATDGVRAGAAFSETDAYWERALTPRFGVVIQPHVDVGGEYGDPGWRGEAVVSGKYQLYRGARGAIALQAGPTWTSEPARGCGEGGGEARALAGRGLANAFINLEAAYRAQAGGCAHGRFDMTVGWKPTGQWLGLAQVFIDQDLKLGAVTKAQASIVRFSRNGKGLQIGIRVRLDRGGGDERALVVGWWAGR